MLSIQINTLVQIGKESFHYLLSIQINALAQIGKESFHLHVEYSN